MDTDYTLQINLSPGDVRYAELTVPALIRAHPDASERLLVVDVCKPQRTGIVDPEKRFPEPAYSQRVARIREIASNLLAAGMVDRVELLEPEFSLRRRLSEKYLANVVQETHDYGGCALMAYLAAFELCNTPWLLHFDADMLIHRSTDHSWVSEASREVAQNPDLIAASPLSSPPLAEAQSLPSQGEKLAHRPHPAGWLSHWFSTRCYLFQMEKLKQQLPLLQGRILWETRFAKWLRRGYPRSPEIMLFRRMQSAGKFRLTLHDQHTWLLHPIDKSDRFVRFLPDMLSSVENGHYPAAQAGHQDIAMSAWEEFLAEDSANRLN